MLHAGFQQLLKKKGLTTQQYNVLKILRGFGAEPRSIDFLRKRMLDRKSDMSRIIDKLFAKKLVDRLECASDRRQKDVTITPAGLELLLQLDTAERQGDQLLKNLKAAELKELNKLLDKIRS
jgi:DNA-binding MarR family transcriptional regulator